MTNGPSELPLPQALAVLADQDPFTQYCSVDYWLHEVGAGDTVHPSIRLLAGQLAANDLGTSHPVDPEQGLACEAKAKVLFAVSLKAQMDHWLNAVANDLRVTLTARPALNIQTCSKLLFAASRHAPNPRRYVIQALRTEPLGLLDLMVQPNNIEGEKLLATLLKGESLPQCLKSLGVTPRAHRLLIRYDMLPLSGLVWLNIARHFDSTGIKEGQHCQAYFKVVHDLGNYGVNEAIGAVSVLDWCIARGNKHIGYRASEFHRRYVLFMEEFGNGRARNLTNNDILSCIIPVRTAFPAETTPRPNPLFANYPDAPSSLNLPPNWELRSLNELEMLLEHGQAIGNCIADRSTAFLYLGLGCAFFGLYVGGHANATFAVMPVRRDYGIVLSRMDEDCKDISIFQNAHWHLTSREIAPCYSAHKLELTRDAFGQNDFDRMLSRKIISKEFEKFTEDLLIACQSPLYAHQWVLRTEQVFSHL